MLHTTCGTPNYVAPEVLREKGYQGNLADVWSCGVILFVMIAGQLPFEDQSLNGLFAKIESGRFTFPPYFSAEAKDLISKMLVVDPAKRITVDGVMKHPWMKGYKTSATAHKVTITDSMMKDCIVQANEQESTGTDKIVQRGKLNAFDLASALMSGTINQLVSSEPASIRRETKFIAQGSATAVLPALASILKELSANPIEKSTDIKCFVGNTSHPFTFTVSVSETTGGFCLVEVRRNKGPILDFNAFYRKFVNALGALVVSQKPQV